MTTAPTALPPTVDRATFQGQLDELRNNGRPIPQWSGLEAGRSDDLGNP